MHSWSRQAAGCGYNIKLSGTFLFELLVCLLAAIRKKNKASSVAHSSDPCRGPGIETRLPNPQMPKPQAQSETPRVTAAAMGAEH